jgi:hypothetical protein
LRAIQRTALFVGIGIVLLLTIFPEELGSRLSIYSETLMPNSARSELLQRTHTYPLQQLGYAFDHPRWYWPVGVSIFTLLAVYVLGMAFSAGLHPLEVKKYGLPGKVFQQIAQAFHRTEEKPAEPDDEPPRNDRVAISFQAYATMCFVALFGICLLCHGELVRIRPPTGHLTSFYLSIAAGGALGGAAVSLLAPYLFVTYFEWTLAVWLGYLIPELVLPLVIAVAHYASH